jgi:hypothetical protein
MIAVSSLSRAAACSSVSSSVFIPAMWGGGIGLWMILWITGFTPVIPGSPRLFPVSMGGSVLISTPICLFIRRGGILSAWLRQASSFLISVIMLVAIIHCRESLAVPIVGEAKIGMPLVIEGVVVDDSSKHIHSMCCPIPYTVDFWLRKIITGVGARNSSACARFGLGTKDRFAPIRTFSPRLIWREGPCADTCIPSKSHVICWGLTGIAHGDHRSQIFASNNVPNTLGWRFGVYIGAELPLFGVLCDAEDIASDPKLLIREIRLTASEESSCNGRQQSSAPYKQRRYIMPIATILAGVSGTFWGLWRGQVSFRRRSLRACEKCDRNIVAFGPVSPKAHHMVQCVSRKPWRGPINTLSIGDLGQPERWNRHPIRTASRFRIGCVRIGRCGDPLRPWEFQSTSSIPPRRGLFLLLNPATKPVIPLSQATLLQINPPGRHGYAMAVFGIGTILGPIMDRRSAAG